jgi:hypothetical protein
MQPIAEFAVPQVTKATYSNDHTFTIERTDGSKYKCIKVPDAPDQNTKQPHLILDNGQLKPTELLMWQEPSTPFFFVRNGDTIERFGQLVSSIVSPFAPSKPQSFTV